jgi:hypothetical protein
MFKIFFNKMANPIISENLHSTFTRRKHLHGHVDAAYKEKYIQYKTGLLHL